MDIKKLLTWQKALAAIGVYFSLLGFFTFPLFIMEESIQVAQGGTWAAKAARYCELHGIDKRLINKVAGQFNLRII